MACRATVKEADMAGKIPESVEMAVSLSERIRLLSELI
jgi:hypothetical protein